MSEHQSAAPLPSAPAPSRLLLFGPAPILPVEESAAYDELLAQASISLRPADLLEEVWLHDYVDLIWEGRRLRRIMEGVLAAAVPKALRETLWKIGGLKDEERELLVKSWIAHEPAAVERVEQYLSAANLTFDAVIARAFCNNIDHLERLGRLMATAEARRNVVLHEIERHRATLAKALRDATPALEQVELQTVAAEPLAPDNTVNEAQ